MKKSHVWVTFVSIKIVTVYSLGNNLAQRYL